MKRSAMGLTKPRLFAIAAALGALGVLTLHACIPADTRPPPGTLTLTVSPSSAVEAGVVTADGWNVTFDRVFVALGNSGFSDNCTVYGEADYDRVINLAAGPNQKLGVLHALGKCDLRFRVGPPSTEVVTGAGVSEEDKIQMQIPTRDPYVTQGESRGTPSNGAGAAFDISAIATRNGVVKRFHLVFRQRVRYQRCTAQTPSPDASAAELNQTAAFGDAGPAVDLAEAQDVVFDLRVEPEALLRDDVNPSAASLRFDPLAAADLDGDGVVTLDELRKIPIGTLRDAGSFDDSTYVVDDAGQFSRGRRIEIATLGDFIYQLLAPTLVRFRGTGWCLASTGRRGGPN